MMVTFSMDSIQFYQPPPGAPSFRTKYTALSYLPLQPPGAPRHKKGSQVLEPARTTAVDTTRDFLSQHNSIQHQDMVDDDEVPTTEELLRPTLCKQVLKGEQALQTAYQRLLQRSSSYVNTSQSGFKNLGDSQGRCINCVYFRRPSSR